MAPEHGRFNASLGAKTGAPHEPRARRTAWKRLTLLSGLTLTLALLAFTGARTFADDAPATASSAPSDSARAAAPETPKPAESAAPAVNPPARQAEASHGAQPGLDDAPAAPAARAEAPAAPPATHGASARAGNKVPHGPAMGSSEAASTPAPAAAAVTAFAPPANFDDVSAWLEYRSHNHIGALPQEARIYYRRGLQLYSTGGFEEAVREVRGACELDPDFVAPHLTLASWFLLREPSQAMVQVATALELSRQNFVLQLALLANALVMLVQSLFLGLLAAALLIVFVHNAELRHTFQERLGSFVELRGARIWAWGLLVFPFLSGLGLALPALVMLGILWSSLRIRERAVFIALTLMVAAAPWVSSSIDRLSLPLRPDQGPFFGIPQLPAEAYSPERQQQMTDLADTQPQDAFAQFALAWLARRGGDVQLAERSYRRALQIWPHDDRVMNNLGNTLAMQGRADEALAMYQKAYGQDPRNAAAYFNASQIFTQRFEYKAANDALSRASALNFDLVKTYQAQATEDGLLPLVDQWLSAETFWKAMPHVRAAPGVPVVLPPGWRSKWECSGWPFSCVVVLLSFAALMAGRRLNRDMPLRNCSNCGCVVCRRCSERRRETALCATCAAVENQAESAEFARVLLMQRRRGVARRWEMLRTALATLIPGFGMLALDHLFTPLLLMATTAGLCAPLLGLKAPFSFEPRLLEGARDAAMWAGVITWLAVYAISLIGYFVASTQKKDTAQAPEVPSRPRSGDRPRRVTAEAA